MQPKPQPRATARKDGRAKPNPAEGDVDAIALNADSKLHLPANTKGLPSDISRDFGSVIKPVQKPGMVLIPKFREIERIPYPKEPVKTTLRRSERILDRLEAHQISPFRRSRRLTPKIAQRRIQQALVEENDEETSESKGEEEHDETSSTQTHSESHDANANEDEEESASSSAEGENENNEESEPGDNDIAKLVEHGPRQVLRNVLPPSAETIRVKTYFVRRSPHKDCLVVTMRRSTPVRVLSLSNVSPNLEEERRPTRSSRQDTAKRIRTDSSPSNDPHTCFEGRSDPKECAALFKENAKGITVALSGFERGERTRFHQVITKLGGRITEEPDLSQVTHVVVPSNQSAPRPRTRKVLYGIAQGAFIVPEQWLEDSAAKGRFIAAERYELKDEFPGAAWRRKRRAGHGLLKGKTILVRGRTNPSQDDIEHILELADAKIASKSNECDFLVGPESFFREAQRMKLPFIADSALVEALCRGQLPL